MIDLQQVFYCKIEATDSQIYFQVLSAFSPYQALTIKSPNKRKSSKWKLKNFHFHILPKTKVPSFSPPSPLDSSCRVFLPSFLTHEEILQELPDLPPDHDGRGRSVYIIVESSKPDSWTGAPPPWKSFNYLPPTSYTADVQSSLLPAPLACSSRLVL